MPRKTIFIFCFIFFILIFLSFGANALSWSDGGDAVPPKELADEFLQYRPNPPIGSNAPAAGDTSLLVFAAAGTAVVLLCRMNRK